MAPEVRRYGTQADPLPADVYSLAKTLWIILTADSKGFDGEFNPNGELQIRTICEGLYISPLERLLAQATDHAPSNRPTMAEFAKGLEEWLLLINDWQRQNRLQWEEASQKLFPVSTPMSATWHDIDSIIAVLNVIGNTPSLNHLFFPDGGGMDFERAVRSDFEPGCIELYTRIPNIIRPSTLYFESFGDDPQWNYFRLECAQLDPSKVYSEYTCRVFEELTDLGCGKYVDRSVWDEQYYQGKALPESARVVVRYLGGSFVIFQKTSQYNLGSGKLDAYDGRHNKMDSEQFRQYIKTYKSAYDQTHARNKDGES